MRDKENTITSNSANVIENSQNRVEDDLEWEEWDGKSPFLHHCIAGGVAGIAEHILLYPFDTIKTHMQSYCADCPHNVKNSAAVSSSLSSPSSSLSAIRAASVGATDHGMWRTMRNLVLHGNSQLGMGSHPAPVAVGCGKGRHRPATNIAASCFPAQTVSPAAATVPQSAQGVNSTTNRIITSGTTGIARLWRGVQTMAVGCAPAHALYFSSYEIVKNLFLNQQNKFGSNAPHQIHQQHHLSPIGSAVAGATATFFHDIIMTPLDTVKQRLQLGHYEGMYNGFQHILQHEGYIGLYRSFSITLVTNIPYGMIMVSTNEFLKEILNPEGQFDLQTCLLAGSGAGFTASALTTPLDRVKTRLQTQTLGSVDIGTTAAPVGTTRTTKCGKVLMLQPPSASFVKYDGWRDALKSIMKEEGSIGLLRGIAPRVMMHTPAVAISWTTYESAKKWLSSS